MTESEWLAAADPTPLLVFLYGKVSQRKLRLFAIACCRRLWQGSTKPANLAALRIAEHLAEAGAIQTVRATVRLRGDQAVLDCGASDPLELVEIRNEMGISQQLGQSTINPILVSVLEHLACNRSDFRPQWFCEAFASAGMSLSCQVQLLREIVRGPFVPLVPPTDWIVWNDGTVPRIAEAIYNEQAFDNLPILADALEEAGCTEADILNHCRQPAEHVRGCWVIDLLLGKA